VIAFRWADETEIGELAEQAYAVRVLDGMHDDRPAAVRAHDGVRLLTADPRLTARRLAPPPGHRLAALPNYAIPKSSGAAVRRRARRTPGRTHWFRRPAEPTRCVDWCSR